MSIEEWWVLAAGYAGKPISYHWQNTMGLVCPKSSRSSVRPVPDDDLAWDRGTAWNAISNPSTIYLTVNA